MAANHCKMWMKYIYYSKEFVLSRASLPTKACGNGNYVTSCHFYSATDMVWLGFVLTVDFMSRVKTCSIYDFLFSFLITENRKPMRNGWAMCIGSADECGFHKLLPKRDSLTSGCRIIRSDWRPFNSFSITGGEAVQAWMVKILSYKNLHNRIAVANHFPAQSFSPWISFKRWNIDDNRMSTSPQYICKPLYHFYISLSFRKLPPKLISLH